MPFSKSDLELAKLVVKGNTTAGGNGYLDYYEKHRVYHPGWDINVGAGWDDYQLPITCPANGKVIFVSRKASNGGFGLHLVIEHKSLGMYSHWLHMDSVNVKNGDIINKGQIIGKVGNSGTQYPHCHLEVWGENHQPMMKTAGYQFYPTGWSKSQVSERYINPSTFIKKGQKEDAVVVPPNIVEIALIKDENSPKIYLKGKDGMLHWIEDENVFKALFGSFSVVRWNVGAIDESLVSFNIKAN